MWLMWLRKRIFNLFLIKFSKLILSSANGKHLSMFGTNWVRQSIFSTVYFTKSTYRSNISNKNLAFKLEYVVSMKYVPDF